MPRGTVVSAALLVAATALATGPAAAAERPPGQPAEAAALLTELRELYHEAGAATEAYNETGERLAEQRAEVERLTARLADTRGELAGARRTAGRLAAAEYRTGGSPELPPVLRLLLTDEEPARALHDTTVARRAAAGQLAEVRRLAEAEHEADALAAEADEAWEEERRLAEEQRDRRDAAHERMNEVAGLLAGLSGEQRSELSAWEERETAAGQREFLAAHRPAEDGDAPDGAADSPGARALAWALDQRGKPYEAGAAGPDAFDPAGLALRAWEHVGVTVPRTSARSWQLLPRVPLEELRPGDLVIYHEDASHTALYAGDGTVVHPPAPGRDIAVTPLAHAPVKGAVRPEAG
ncbi:Cell wall-associated hydrolase, NlpC family [Streptomyces zhaozhouensis]|uniref:Cell wall-associated hydrolase, NlpC family n=1 Tax=Streptomyces zhaozhouensis TaxID=1300267 RepID=A0A286DQ40_9ACTN|nr:NlpC/P60 family protein [Streptomyces zhaozhouensis]SOD60743.1 Cell wall-associated hydrolase, NlpC family [Streptomyces zhaozhouensis]